jgi:hypothetical protein
VNLFVGKVQETIFLTLHTHIRTAKKALIFDAVCLSLLLSMALWRHRQFCSALASQKRKK